MSVVFAKAAPGVYTPPLKMKDTNKNLIQTKMNFLLKSLISDIHGMYGHKTTKLYKKKKK